MINNLIKNINGYSCVRCGNNIKEIDNFCRNCGEPISVEAKKLKEEQELSIKLKTVKEIIEITKNPLIIDYLKTLRK